MACSLVLANYSLRGDSRSSCHYNTDKFQEWNFPKYQAIMSGGQRRVRNLYRKNKEMANHYHCQFDLWENLTICLADCQLQSCSVVSGIQLFQRVYSQKNCLNSTKTERNKLLDSSEFGTFILLIGTHTVGITLK